MRWLAGTALLVLAVATSAATARQDGPPERDMTGAATHQVVLAAEDDAAPWSYADGSGFVNDLVLAAFREAGWSVQLSVMPYARCKALALHGDIAGCFTTSHAPGLDAGLMFPAEPVIDPRHVIVARNGTHWQGCDPARWGARPLVGTVRGYEYVPEADALFSRDAARADVSDSEITNLRKLRAGRIDLALVVLDDVKRLDYLARLAAVPPDFRTVCDLGPLPGYVAFSRRHPQGAAALAAFDAGMARLKRRGGLAPLVAAWRTRALDAAAAKVH